MPSRNTTVAPIPVAPGSPKVPGQDGTATASNQAAVANSSGKVTCKFEFRFLGRLYAAIYLCLVAVAATVTFTSTDYDAGNDAIWEFWGEFNP
jgi:hypothetical protein